MAQFTFVETEHPRVPRGSRGGGQFASKGKAAEVPKGRAAAAPKGRWQLDKDDHAEVARYKQYDAERPPPQHVTDLSGDESKALTAYAGHLDALIINHKLRNPASRPLRLAGTAGQLSEEHQAVIGGLDKLLQRARLPEDMHLYRLISPDFAERIKQMEPGDVIRDEGFLSMSYVPRTGVEAFGTKLVTPPGTTMHILAPAGSRAMVVPSVDIEEHEVLGARGSRLEFMGVDEDDAPYFKLKSDATLKRQPNKEVERRYTEYLKAADAEMTRRRREFWAARETEPVRTEVRPSPTPETDKISKTLKDVAAGEEVIGFLTPDGRALSTGAAEHDKAAWSSGTTVGKLLQEGTERIYATKSYFGIETGQPPTAAQVDALAQLAQSHAYERFVVEQTNGMFEAVDGPVTARSVRETIDKAFPKVEPIAEFVSPNVGNLTFDQARAEVDGERQQLLREASGEIDRRLGLSSRADNVIGAWADGAENSVMVRMRGATLEQARISAAMKGWISDQKSVLVFAPNESGSEFMARFDVKDNDAAVHERLLQSGVTFHTLEPGDGKTTVHVYGQDQDTLNKVSEAAKSYGAKVKVVKGQGEFIGTQLQEGDDRAQRDDARRVYEDIIYAGQLPGRDVGRIWDSLRDHWSRTLAQAGGVTTGVGGPGGDPTEQIRAVLTPDLLRGKYKAEAKEGKSAGHCYAAAEAAFHMLGGSAAGWKPMMLNAAQFPDGLKPGQTHWFVQNKDGRIVDPTSDQYGDVPVPYDRAKGKGFLTKQPSARAKEIMRRVGEGPVRTEVGGPMGRARGVQARGEKVAEALKAYWQRWCPYRDKDTILSSAQVMQKDLETVAKEIEDVVGAKFVNPGPKSPESLERKLNGPPPRPPQSITDAVRGGFEVLTPQQAERVLEILARHHPVADEGWKPTKEGYVDRKLIMRFKDGSLGEVQIWPPGMLAAKQNWGHKLYEEMRRLSKQNPLRGFYVRRQQMVYNAVTSKLGPEWRRIIHPQQTTAAAA